MTAFVKMHGCGNDFVVLEGPVALTPERVRELCDRRRGIGADGIVVLGGSGLRRGVVVHNADGSLADACGNGYRCAARNILDSVGADRCELETPIGSVEAWRDPAGIALRLAAPVLGPRLVVQDGAGPMAAREVRVGNPNVVVFVAEVAGLDLVALAKEARAAAGPANVAAVAVRSRGELELRVEERGVGETLACGTGSCAAVAAALDDDRVDAGGPIRVRLPGGTLTITPDGAEYILAGPAEYVFEGEAAFG